MKFRTLIVVVIAVILGIHQSGAEDKVTLRFGHFPKVVPGR